MIRSLIPSSGGSPQKNLSLFHAFLRSASGAAALCVFVSWWLIFLPSSAFAWTPTASSNVSAGDVVVCDADADNAVETTTTSGAAKVCGIAMEAKTAGQTVFVVDQGDYVAVNAAAGTTRGQYLIAHTVAGQCIGVDTLQDGVFGIARTTVSSGQIKAILLLGLGDAAADGIASDDLDTEAELETQLTDVDDVHTNNDTDMITEAMLDATNAAADEYTLTYETTDDDFEWHAPSEWISVDDPLVWRGGFLLDILADGINDQHLDFGSGADQFDLDDLPDGSSYERVAATELSSGIYKDATTAVKGISSFVSSFFSVTGGAVSIANDAITEALLKSVNASGDEYILTKEDSTGDFEWQAPSELIDTDSTLSWYGGFLLGVTPDTYAAAGHDHDADYINDDGDTYLGTHNQTGATVYMPYGTDSSGLDQNGEYMLDSDGDADSNDKLSGLPLLTLFGAAAKIYMIGIVDSDLDDAANGWGLVLNTTAKRFELAELPGAAGGETNTGENLGAGVGVYEGKSGTTLQFNSLTSPDSTVSISEDDPNDEIDLEVNGIPQTAGDVTVTSTHNIEVDTVENQLVIDFGSGGDEGDGEAAFSPILKGSIAIDPGAWYDTDTQVFLTEIGDEAPNGIIIDEWKCSCDVDPDVEINANLKYADAWIGLANSAVIDAIDTTNGASSEDTDANINGGAVVANGKVIYIEFDADPEGTCVQMIFTMWWHVEED